MRLSLTLLCLVGSVNAFAFIQKSPPFSTKLFETTSSSSSNTRRSSLSVPLTYSEMVRQVSTTLKEASQAGIDNQIVRILLPRDANNAKFGVFAESRAETTSETSQIKLVPPDESWQGGIMQLLRSATPTCMEILSKFTQDDSGLNTRIIEDRSVDESGVDGVSRLQTDSVQLFVQPTQEVVADYVLPVSQPTILVNPQWRQVDDALDSASSDTDGIVGKLANFLGGKGNTLKQLNDAKFVPTYTLEGYVCRGANVRLLQKFNTDWEVFCERDNEESYVRVGTSVSRPTYQQVEDMLNANNIGYKYARDMGLEEKI